MCGTSGSGKTYGSLLIAKGLGGKIALIDTENGSGSLYENVCDYDVAEIAPPFTVEKYINCIHEAEKAGYNVLIIDSLSHAWAGQGGLLEEVDKRNKGNSFTAWRDVTPMHNKLVDTILQAQLHIIVTMRTKTAYELEKNDKGKVTPTKKGMAPIQRDGLEYEFTVVFDLDNDKHMAQAGKDRTSLFDGKMFVPDTSTGEALKEWLEEGLEPLASDQQCKEIFAKSKELGLSADDMKAILKFKFKIGSSKEITVGIYNDLIHNLDKIWNDYVAENSKVG